MNEPFYYITVEINGDKIFVGKDAEFTGDFEAVLRFRHREHAEDFIEQQKLEEMNPKILRI